MPTWLGLRSTSCQKRVSSFSFFIFPLGLKFDYQFFQIFILSFLSGLTLNYQFFKFSFLLIWTYPRLSVLSNFHFFHLDLPLIANSSNFHFLSGLNSDCHLFKFSFFIHLNLPLIANSLNFHFLSLDLPLIASLIVLWLYHSCLPDWTYTFNARLIDIFWENSNLSKLSSFVRKSFWNFYRVQDPLSSCIPILDMNTYLMQCVVQCMIVHEWNVRVFIFHLNLFHSFFIFPCFQQKCRNANVMPQLCRWNTMIGITNVICKHCALTFGW